MSREYSVFGENLTIAGATTLAFVFPASGRVIEVVRAWASQSGTTTQAQIRIALGTKASGGTFTTFTPQKIKTSDPVSLITGGTAGAAGTAGINCSSEAGTFTNVYPDSFNNVAGWIWTPNVYAGESLIVSGADSVGAALKILAAPSILAGWTFGITYRELG